MLKGLCEASEAEAPSAEEEHNTTRATNNPKPKGQHGLKGRNNQTKSFDQFINSGFYPSPNRLGDVFGVALAEALRVWLCKLRPKALGRWVDAFQHNVWFTAATTYAFPPRA